MFVVVERACSFFSICAHPDDNQRRQLSESTGLLLHQVKFWFQNKRTHVKVWFYIIAIFRDNVGR